MENFFSERYGFQRKDVEALLKANSKGMTERLRTYLWNVYYDTSMAYLEFCEQQGNYLIEGVAPYKKKGLFYESFIKPLIANYIGYPLNELKGKSKDFIDNILYKIFFKSQWFQVYDLIEILAETLKNNNPHLFEHFQKQINTALKKEIAPYRMIEGKVVPLKDEEEVKSVVSALEKTRNDKFQPVYEHLTKVISLLSDRESPDYGNSIKESLSAIESLFKIIYSNNETLGKNIKRACSDFGFHKAFCEAISKLYGWASDDKGIRHGKGLNESEPSQAEAKFILVTASAFINYILDILAEKQTKK